MSFCPVCGKRTANDFCDEHREVSVDYKDIVVRVCECRRYFHRNKWLPFDSLKNVVKKVAKDNIKEKIIVNPLIGEDIVKQVFELEVSYLGKEFIIPAKLVVEKCPQCSRIGTQYYESIIQLRPKDDELLEFVKNQVKNIKAVFISKVEELKEGWDVYTSSNKAAMQIGSKLKKSFKGELKTSRKIFGRDKQKSKDLYRVTILFRKE